MATVQIYNAIQGHRALVEYKGSAGDVVLLNAYVLTLVTYPLRSVPLGYARGVPLTAWQDKTFDEGISSFQILPTATAQANSNGIVHRLIETSGLSAGVSLKVETTTI